LTWCEAAKGGLRDGVAAYRDGSSHSLCRRENVRIGYNPAMAEYLDLENWERRELFEFFRNYDKPYFNVCTQVDITALLKFLSDRGDLSISLAYHYFALRLANEIESFRYRLRNGRVLIHDVIHGGTTVLMPNDVFTLAYFDYFRDFEQFMREAQEAIGLVKAGDGALRPLDDDDARLHFTTLPWIAFTSFSHARNWKREDSIPKIAFGKFSDVNGRTMLPISVEVHHALADGVHVGKYLNRMEEALASPEEFLSS
jgi:chloramphenicol O-acetyltransferase type A